MSDPAETPTSLEKSPRDLGDAYREFRTALGEDSDRARLRFAVAAVVLGGCAGIVVEYALESLLGGIVVFLAYPFIAKLLLRPIRAAVKFAAGTLSQDDAGEAAVAALLWPVGFPTFVPLMLFIGLVRRVP